MSDANGDRRAMIVARMSRAIQQADWTMADKPNTADRIADAAYQAAIAAGMRDVPDEVADAIQESYDEVVAERDRLRAIVDGCGLCAYREQERKRDAAKDAAEQTALEEATWD